MSLWGTLGGALLGAGQAYFNYRGVKRTNEANVAMSREQMDFQREMSSTAHQREVADMIAAGRHPWSGSGSGATTPAGAKPDLHVPRIEMPDMLSFGISLKQLELAQEQLQIDKANSAAGIAKSLSEEELNKAKKILVQKGMIRAEAEGKAADLIEEAIDRMMKMFKTPQGTPNLNPVR